MSGRGRGAPMINTARAWLLAIIGIVRLCFERD